MCISFLHPIPVHWAQRTLMVESKVKAFLSQGCQAHTHTQLMFCSSISRYNSLQLAQQQPSLGCLHQLGTKSPRNRSLGRSKGYVPSSLLLKSLIFFEMLLRRQGGWAGSLAVSRSQLNLPAVFLLSLICFTGQWNDEAVTSFKWDFNSNSGNAINAIL